MMADHEPTSTTGQPPTDRPLPQKGRAPGAGSAQIATPPEVPEDLRAALEAGHEMGRRIAGFDWTSTPLGPMAGWPQSTRTVVAVCVTSRFPIVLWFGPDLVTIYNDGYAPMLGEKHPGSLGRPGRQVWPEIWDTIGPMFQAVLERGEATWSDDQFLPLVRKGYPEECYFTFTYSPIRGEDGAVGGVFCAVTETTQRVIGERRLRTLRELADELGKVRAEEDAFAIARRVLVRNPTDIPFALLYRAGARGPEPAGSTGPAGDDDPGAWPLPQSGWVKVEEPRRALVVPLRDLGEERCVGWLVAGVSDLLELDDDYRSFLELAGGQLAAALANARAYEAERRRAEALAELDRAKTVFFSNMSHELRTPLALILGPTEDALAAGTTSSADAARVHKVVQRNARRLQKLVEGMLDFSRLEAGRMQADLRPIGLAGFTADLASQFRSAVERAGLALEIDCPLLPRPVRVDQDMWEKIVLNLLSNALKFTFEGTITVRLTSQDGQVVLSVSDTGVGIPAGEVPRLFERFHRVPGARSRTHEGTGIGLALVSELVHLHGGQITVESTEGQGSTFRVRLPARMEDHAVTPDERPGPRRAGWYVEEALRWLPDASAESGDEADSLVAPSAMFDPDTRVVVVDDEADLRDYLRRILSAYWTVDVYTNGAVALEAISVAAPQLVITDVMMPGLDGFGLLKALREHPATQRMPVIMLSARAGEEAAVEGLTHGADDYLVKPFSSRELVARVRANLDLARLREEAIQREHRVAVTLQESLLPKSLPEIDGVALAARYIAGSAEVQVGGDWYDVLPLADGTVAVTVGDVVGRGVQAAATMGQLRNAVRVLLLQGHPPGAALAELNRLVGTLGDLHFSTAVLGRLDPATGTLRFASAGHPPPLLLQPDGSTTYLEGGRSVPLGALPDASYDDSTVHLDAGSTLLIYTDGLVERRGEDLDQGLGRLAALAADCQLPPGGLVDIVLEGMSDGAWVDDVVVLAVGLP